MFRSLVLLSIKCLILCVASFQIPELKNVSLEVPHEDFVYFLDDSNFELVTNNQPIIVVKFYSKNVNHQIIKKLEFDVAAKISAAEEKIPFAIVELSNSPNLEKKYKFLKNPSIKVFMNGNEMEFFGPYGPEDMVTAITKYKTADFSRSKALLTITEEEAMEILNNHKISAILIYEDCPRSEYLLKEYLAALPVLKEIYDFPVFIFESKVSLGIQKRYHVKTLPEILVCYRTSCYEHEKHQVNIMDIVPKLISLLNNEHKINKLEELLEHQEHQDAKLIPHFLTVVDSENGKEFEVIEHMMAAYQINTPIYYSTNKSLIPLIGCNGSRQCLRIHYPSYVGLPDDDEFILKELLKDDQLRNESKVADYIVNFTFPLVSYKNTFDGNQFELYRKNHPILIYFGDFGYNSSYFPSSNEQIKRTHKARVFLVPLAKKHPDIKFTVSSIDDLRYESFKSNLEEGKEVIIIIDEYNINYIMDGSKEITLENIDIFISHFKRNQVEPTIMSLQEPRISYFYGFKIAVMKTLKKCISVNEKDTILLLVKNITIFKIYYRDELDILAHIIDSNKFLNQVIMETTGQRVPSIFGRLSDINVFMIPSGNIKKLIPYLGTFDFYGVFNFIREKGDLSLQGWENDFTDEL